jgi:hypothetical protein
VKPRFDHDCVQCILLGRIEHGTAIHPDFMPSDEDWSKVFELAGTKHVDLYFCTKQGSDLPTVIARYSDEGSDYASGLHSAAAIPDLAIAKRMAQAKGLLPK